MSGDGKQERIWKEVVVVCLNVMTCMSLLLLSSSETTRILKKEGVEV